MLPCRVPIALAVALVQGCGRAPQVAVPIIDRPALEADLRAFATPRWSPGDKASAEARARAAFVGCEVRSAEGALLCEAGQAPWVYLAAHLDTVRGTPGADDDATGVAGVIAVARALAGRPCEVGIRYALFDGEEDGLRGSRAHVATLRRDEVRAAVVLEMIGFTGPRQAYPPGLSTAWFWRDFPSSGDFLAVLGDFRSRGLVAEVADAAAPRVKVEGLSLPPLVSVPDFRRSDQAPFWDAGIPAVMVTDTANFRNPHYHRASDTIETLDLDFYARAVEGVAAAVADLARCR